MDYTNKYKVYALNCLRQAKEWRLKGCMDYAIMYLQMAADNRRMAQFHFNRGL